MGDRWDGVVLTGGRSSRMGRDKALIEVDGVAMAVRVANAMTGAGAARVRCVGGDVSGLRALGLDAVPDSHENEGPLAGVLAGLGGPGEPIVLVAPCDLVEPTPRLFIALFNAMVTNDADVVVPTVDDRWHPLPVALRRATVRMRLAESFADGERALQRALERLDIVAVDIGPIADADAPGDLPDHR